MGTVYSDEALKSGIENSGKRSMVSIVDGKPVKTEIPV